MPVQIQLKFPEFLAVADTGRCLRLMEKPLQHVVPLGKEQNKNVSLKEQKY